MAEAQPGARSHAVARYKELLRDYIDRRPSGLRGKLALALGKHKSFISQITNPAYAVPIPAGDLATIFALCHLAPEEREAFMRLYRAAHPERARRLRPVERRARAAHPAAVLPQRGARARARGADPRFRRPQHPPRATRRRSRCRGAGRAARPDEPHQALTARAAGGARIFLAADGTFSPGRGSSARTAHRREQAQMSGIKVAEADGRLQLIWLFGADGALCRHVARRLQHHGGRRRGCLRGRRRHERHRGRRRRRDRLNLTFVFGRRASARSHGARSASSAAGRGRKLPALAGAVAAAPVKPVMRSLCDAQRLLHHRGGGRRPGDPLAPRPGMTPAPWNLQIGAL